MECVFVIENDEGLLGARSFTLRDVSPHPGPSKSETGAEIAKGSHRDFCYFFLIKKIDFVDTINCIILLFC